MLPGLFAGPRSGAGRGGPSRGAQPSPPVGNLAEQWQVQVHRSGRDSKRASRQRSLQATERRGPVGAGRGRRARSNPGGEVAAVAAGVGSRKRGDPGVAPAAMTQPRPRRDPPAGLSVGVPGIPGGEAGRMGDADQVGGHPAAGHAGAGGHTTLRYLDAECCARGRLREATTHRLPVWTGRTGKPEDGNPGVGASWAASCSTRGPRQRDNNKHWNRWTIW